MVKKHKEVKVRKMLDLTRYGGEDLWWEVKSAAGNAKQPINEWLAEAIKFRIEQGKK